MGHQDSKKVDRRAALRTLGGFAAVTIVGCTSSDTSGSGGGGGASSTACAVTPEGEIGPYFTDDSDARFDRSDIRGNLDGSSVQAGIPLTLTIQVVDTENACAAYEGAQVDIWHCNAKGVYSNESVENTKGQTWLRGYQKTDPSGNVVFKTIVPGWYQGRTTHIHVRVRSSYSNASSTSDGSNTTQLFFDQDLVDQIADSVAPYSAEGENDTTNASDHVYTDQTHGEMKMTLTGSASAGFTGSAIIHLPIT